MRVVVLLTHMDTFSRKSVWQCDDPQEFKLVGSPKPFLLEQGDAEVNPLISNLNAGAASLYDEKILQQKVDVDSIRAISFPLSRD